jgi:hypothetical protein
MSSQNPESSCEALNIQKATSHDAESGTVAELSRNIQREWMQLSRADKGNQDKLHTDWHKYLSHLSSDAPGNSHLSMLKGFQITGATEDGGIKVRDQKHGVGATEKIISANGSTRDVVHQESWGNEQQQNWFDHDFGPNTVSVNGKTVTYEGKPQELGRLADRIYSHYTGLGNGHDTPDWYRETLVQWLQDNNQGKQFDYSHRVLGMGAIYTSENARVLLPNQTEFKSLIKNTPVPPPPDNDGLV